MLKLCVECTTGDIVLFKLNIFVLECSFLCKLASFIQSYLHLNRGMRNFNTDRVAVQGLTAFLQQMNTSNQKPGKLLFPGLFFKAKEKNVVLLVADYLTILMQQCWSVDVMLGLLEPQIKAHDK